MLADYLPHMLVGWSIQLVGVLSPGPSVMLISGIALARGRLPAVTSALGVGAGSALLATATVLGLSALIAATAEVMTLIRIVGALYLFWLAWKAFGKAVNPPAIRPAEVGRRSIPGFILRGFALQATNPKAILFWLAIAGVGGLGGAPVPVLAVFILGAFVNSFCGHALYAVALSTKPLRALYLKAQRGIVAVLGTVFLLAGLRLALSRSCQRERRAPMINETIRQEAGNAVLCWLASVDPDGVPNVTPKQAFRIADDGRVLIADIASAGSVRNLKANPLACVSFLDVFRQTGFKLVGRAEILGPEDAQFEAARQSLQTLIGPKFTIRHVIAVTVTKVERIRAPSYVLFGASEADMMDQAYADYGVRPA